MLPADVSINTYDLFPILDGVVSIFGTAGLEAAMLGKKVILAGHAHYGSKGFTYDSPTRADYVANLSAAAALAAPTLVQVEIARRYAYEYFISRQLPLDPVVAYAERQQGQLDPRRQRMLRKWADTILSGDAFAMDDNEVEFFEEFPEIATDDGPGVDWAGLDRVANSEPADETAPRPLSGVFG